MDEDAQRTIATFRFGVISDLVGRRLNRGEKELILKEKSSARWDIPFSTRSTISRSTILSWVRAYEKGGRRLQSLYPDKRKDKGRSRVMDEEAICALVTLKKDRMNVSLPVLLKEARAKGILPAHYMVSYAPSTASLNGTASRRQIMSIRTDGGSKRSSRTISGSPMRCTDREFFMKGSRKRRISLPSSTT